MTGNDVSEENPTPIAPPAPAEPPAEPATPEITIDEFLRVDLRVATIRKAEPHPNADRLVVLSVDVGEEQERQLVAGIRAAYEPESLVGKQIVVVANLKPAKLRGVESRGMILAASDDSGVHVLSPDAPTAPGAKVK
jgi:methionine--tRNA ligase beta chain